MKTAAVASARTRVLVAHSDSLGRVAPAWFAQLSDFDVIETGQVRNHPAIDHGEGDLGDVLYYRDTDPVAASRRLFAAAGVACRLLEPSRDLLSLSFRVE